ncbi:MAG: DUF1592 domain-containing protein [Verrucomicrobiota bacterium]
MEFPRRVATFCVVLFLALVARAQALPENDWEIFLADYCLDCHDSGSAKGGIDLEWSLDASLSGQREMMEKVIRQLDGRMMPPVGKFRPTEEEYSVFVGKLVERMDAYAEVHPHPGRTETLRRMTRYEYQNAIRDLLGIEIDAKTLLPPDQSSHGFDNITVGDLSPALLDRYISAAQKISRQALGRNGDSPDSRTVRVKPDITQDGHVEGLPFGTRGGVLFRHDFPRDGEYEVRINLMRDRNEKVEGLSGKSELQVLVDGGVATSFMVSPPEKRNDHTKVDAHLASRIKVDAGTREVGVTFVKGAPEIRQTLRRPYESAFNYHRHPRQGPAVYQVTITGPFGADSSSMALNNKHLLGDAVELSPKSARSILRRLVQVAYRGMNTEAGYANAMAFYLESAMGGSVEDGFEAALSAILVSPNFLFRIERDRPGEKPGEPYALNDLELASRLSFFLWSSIPDEQLLAAAKARRLTNPEGLAAEVTRMLADPKARALAENFAGQWLYLRNLDSIQPDGRLYPDFDENLRRAMRRETEMLFENVMREDRSILELLQSDFTFLNERLAKHYGIPHIYGERFRKVALRPEHGRGGLLRHGSILTVTSYANRTSPVLRGHWVLENLLGTPPPPAPPDVPALEDNPVDASLPVRERLAAHRDNPGCAGCHSVMDPIGFAFEYYDAIGQFRSHEADQPVDATGAMADGTKFDGLEGLESGLVNRPELFARTLTEKLLTYALGRGVESSDAPAVRKIVRSAAVDDNRFSSIIQAIVASEPFTMRMPEEK